MALMLGLQADTPQAEAMARLIGGGLVDDARRGVSVHRTPDLMLGAAMS